MHALEFNGNKCNILKNEIPKLKEDMDNIPNKIDGYNNFVIQKVLVLNEIFNQVITFYVQKNSQDKLWYYYIEALRKVVRTLNNKKLEIDLLRFNNSSESIIIPKINKLVNYIVCVAEQLHFLECEGMAPTNKKLSPNGLTNCLGNFDE
jgi:hypothetical protein